MNRSGRDRSSCVYFELILNFIMQTMDPPSNYLSRIETFLLTSSGDLTHRFFMQWDMISLLRLRHLSVQLRTVVDVYIMCRWSAKSFFHWWFQNPTGFRCMLRDTGSVVSGSQALAFFDRTRRSASNLDVVVPSEWIDDFGAWLIVQENYTFESITLASTTRTADEFQESGNDPNIWTPFLLNPIESNGESQSHHSQNSHERCIFTKRVVIEGRGVDRKVQLITADHGVIDKILSFHSSECTPSYMTSCMLING